MVLLPQLSSKIEFPNTHLQRIVPKKTDTFFKKKHGIYRTQASFVHFSTFLFPSSQNKKFYFRELLLLFFLKETQKSQFINCPPQQTQQCYQKKIPFQQSKHKLEANHIINFETIRYLKKSTDFGKLKVKAIERKKNRKGKTKKKRGGKVYLVIGIPTNIISLLRTIMRSPFRNRTNFLPKS